MYDILQLNEKLVTELREIATTIGIKGANRLTKQDLVYKILDEQALAAKSSGGELVPEVDEPAPGRKIVVRKPAAAVTAADEDKAAPAKRGRKPKQEQEQEVAAPPAVQQAPPPPPPPPLPFYPFTQGFHTALYHMFIYPPHRPRKPGSAERNPTFLLPALISGTMYRFL